MVNRKLTIGLIAGIIVLALIGVIFYRNNAAVKGDNFPPPVTEKKGISMIDSAVDFGYKCMWFAIKTSNRSKLVEMLHLKNVVDCNWQNGIRQAYDGYVFVTPAIEGWVLVCGLGLPYGDTKESIAEVKAILQNLSKEFGEAQFFCTHRVVEYHCWMKATNGQVVRVYSYSGESGENIVIEGQPTEFERTLKLANTLSEEAKDSKYLERNDIVWPNEDLVMKIAEHWSINPMKLKERKDIPPVLGLLGHR